MANYLAPEDNPVNLLAARMNPNLAAQGLRGRQNMAAPESVMDSRYAAWKKSQEDAELLGLMSDMALSAVPLAGPAARGAMAAGRSLAPTAGRMTENYMLRSGMMLPLDTWHGTPHRFPPTAKNPLGEFDPTKIGTGEGAQAYGAGAGYLAENPQTARIYSADRAYVGSAMQGKPSTINFDDPAWLAQKTIDEFGDTSKATSHLKMVQRTAAKHQSSETKAQVQAAIDLLESGNIATKGNLYKVDLPDEQIAKMLDWDKPLSQQSWYRPVADVVKEYKGAGKDVDAYAKLISKANARGGEVTGGQLYEGMLSQFGGDQTKVSAFMREAGIPGIRYLDQGSRHLSNWEVGKANQEGTKWLLKNNEMAPSLWKTFNTKTEADAALKIADPMASGTSNFVVFDPKHMNLIGRE